MKASGSSRAGARAVILVHMVFTPLPEAVSRQAGPLLSRSEGKGVRLRPC